MPAMIRWARVNDEPFEYAIQQGPHGDEFVKLLDGKCLCRDTSSDVGAPPQHSWRMAQQGFEDSGFKLLTEPHGDGYVMTINIGFHRRRVFFDAAGRVTHVRGARSSRLIEA